VPKTESRRDQFEMRRRKEQVAFLVVRFLRAAVAFRSISASFKECARKGSLERSGLFEPVHELVNGQLFDLKESAHALFRAEAIKAKGKRTATRFSAETRSLDSHIGTGYHLLLILQETLYQLERYGPELEREKDDASVKIASDAEELTRRVMERCRGLFRRTAEVVRAFLTSSHDNEILVLNLIQNRELLDTVYGEGAAEDVLSAICTGPDFHGQSGLERALNYVRERCGNVTALPSAAAEAAVS